MSQLAHFWKDYYIYDVSSEYHIKRQIMSLCPITGDINFDHLAKVVSARFFLTQGTTSPFVIFNLEKKS